MVDEELKRLRKECQTYLPTLLSIPMKVNEIYERVKKTFPELCDNQVPCSCGGVVRKQPEWCHQVRWALQDLKDRAIVEYNNFDNKWKRKTVA